MAQRVTLLLLAASFVPDFCSLFAYCATRRLIQKTHSLLVSLRFLRPWPAASFHIPRSRPLPPPPLDYPRFTRTSIFFRRFRLTARLSLIPRRRYFIPWKQSINIQKKKKAKPPTSRHLWQALRRRHGLSQAARPRREPAPQRRDRRPDLQDRHAGYASRPWLAPTDTMNDGLTPQTTSASRRARSPTTSCSSTQATRRAAFPARCPAHPPQAHTTGGRAAL